MGAASGSAARLESAANTLSMPAEDVLQAARFYVQEILLHADADPYRVLGVEADADHARIKRHYRALQQWLHPDRLANSPESIYSARVNQAWDQLRTPARRKMFDEASADVGPVEQGVRTTAAHIPRWQRVAHRDGSLWRPQLFAGLTLVALCAALLWLSLRETPAPAFPEPRTATQASSGAVETPVSVLEPAQENASSSAPLPGGREFPDVVSVAVDALAEASTALSAARSPDPGAVAPGAAVLRSDSPALSGPLPAAEPDARVAAPKHVRSVPEAATSASRSPAKAIATQRPAEIEEHHPVAADALLERHRGARQQATRLLAFLTQPRSAPPPIWRNMRALDSAEAIRSELSGGAVFRRAKVQEDRAHWTLGEDVAVLFVPVIPAERASGARLLQASLVWHQDGWWVDAVTLQAAP